MYQDEIIEHWCDNILCEQFTNNPDNDEGLRYTLDGDETMKHEQCCIVCRKPLISRLDLILQGTLYLLDILVEQHDRPR